MSTSIQQPVQTLPTMPVQPFRLDLPLHDLLQKAPIPPTLARAGDEPENSLSLPSPIFPQQPALGVLANGGGLAVPGALNKFSVFAQRLIRRRVVPRSVAKLSKA
jgi:hypothetical protein